MAKLVSAALAVACLALGGCATVETTPYLERTQSAGDALPGLTYRLPMLQYQLTVVRTLMECPGFDSEGKPTALKFAVDVSADGSYVPGEAYSVDTAPLTGLLKTSSFEVNYYPSGTLKSIGVQAEDKTGEVVVNTAKIVGAGLVMASGAPAIATATAAAAGAALATTENKATSNFSTALVRTETDPLQLVCKPKTVESVAALAAAGKTLKAKAEQLRQINRDLRNVTDLIALRIKKPADLVAPGKPTCVLDKRAKPTVRDEYTCLVNKQTETSEAILTTEREKAELIKALSVSQTYTWPSQFAEARDATELPLNAENRAALAKLVETGHPVRVTGFNIAVEALAGQLLAEKSDAFTGATTKGQVSSNLRALVQTQAIGDPTLPAECLGENATVDACLNYHLNLRLTPVADWPLANDCRGAADTGCVVVREPTDKRAIHARDGTASEGLFIREPASGRLLVCRNYAATYEGCPASADIAELKSANFPQLGQLRFLPFNVAMFQAKDMGVFIGEDGRLQRYYMKSTKAAAEAATASMASAATEISGALEKREEERKSDLEYAQNAEAKALQAQITTFDNQEKRKKQTSTAPADPLAPVRDETSVNQVYIAQLESQLTRQQLQAAIDRGDDAAAQALLAIIRGKSQ